LWAHGGQQDPDHEDVDDKREAITAVFGALGPQAGVKRGKRDGGGLAVDEKW
jgi:hypothetical protein